MPVIRPCHHRSFQREKSRHSADADRRLLDGRSIEPCGQSIIFADNRFAVDATLVVLGGHLGGVGVERRLAAILASDIDGYSRLLGKNEAGTLARVRALRRELINPNIPERHGRIVKATGDGILIDVDACQRSGAFNRRLLSAICPRCRRFVVAQGARRRDPAIESAGDLANVGLILTKRDHAGSTDAMAHLGRNAIVIGASMGGLLAARALADFYDEVTIFERDELPEAYESRKGVPQGRHAHGLLARGREVLDELFAGFSEEMVARGAIYGDIVDDVRWFNHSVYLTNAPSGLQGLLISRPMLESGVRRRVLQLPNVRLRPQTDVAEPVFDRAGGRVTGVRVETRDASPGPVTIGAELVVDATGRGSRSPAWLEAEGYGKVREESIQVNIGYMTRFYRRRPEHLDGKQAVILAACRPDWRLGVILAQEEDRWIVTLGGYFGDYAPAEDAGFVEFARSLQSPAIYEVIRDAEPLTPLTPYQFNANLRRHFEELTRFPDGYLVFGDALCSFNPIYGQGMTVASLEALALRDCLATGGQDMARRFFRAASRLIDNPWQIAVGSDLQNPDVPGDRPAQVRFINWYLAKLYRAGRRDAVLATRFLKVANLMTQPASLMAPQVALRVWNGNRAAA